MYTNKNKKSRISLIKIVLVSLICWHDIWKFLWYLIFYDVTFLFANYIMKTSRQFLFQHFIVFEKKKSSISNTKKLCLNRQTCVYKNEDKINYHFKTMFIHYYKHYCCFRSRRYLKKNNECYRSTQISNRYYLTKLFENLNQRFLNRWKRNTAKTFQCSLFVRMIVIDRIYNHFWKQKRSIFVKKNISQESILESKIMSSIQQFWIRTKYQTRLRQQACFLKNFSS